MKWIGGKTEKEKINYNSNWHKCFAWYPVTINEIEGRKIKIWLEYVLRKLTNLDDDGIMTYYHWEYKEIKELLEEDFMRVKESLDKEMNNV